MKREVVFGFLAGGIVGWIIGELLADHFAPEYYYETGRYEEEVNKQQEALKLTKMKTHEEPKEDIKKLVEKYNNDGDEVNAIPTDPHEWGLIEHDYEEPPDEDMEEDEYETYLTKEVDPENDEIILIRPSDYEQPKPGFKRTVLHWYNENEVLTDSKAKPIPNWEKIIGEDSVWQFGSFSDDPNIVYVVNKRLKGVYKVISHDAAFNNTPLVQKPITRNVFKDKENIIPDQDEEGDDE